MANLPNSSNSNQWIGTGSSTNTNTNTNTISSSPSFLPSMLVAPVMAGQLQHVPTDAGSSPSLPNMGPNMGYGDNSIAEFAKSIHASQLLFSSMMAEDYSSADRRTFTQQQHHYQLHDVPIYTFVNAPNQHQHQPPPAAINPDDNEEYDDGQIHSLPHSRNGPYTCSKCHNVYLTSQQFASHVSSVHYKSETKEQRRRRQIAKAGRRNLKIQHASDGTLTVVPVSYDREQEHGATPPAAIPVPGGNTSIASSSDPPVSGEQGGAVKEEPWSFNHPPVPPGFEGVIPPPPGFEGVIPPPPGSKGVIPRPSQGIRIKSEPYV